MSEKCIVCESNLIELFTQHEDSNQNVSISWSHQYYYEHHGYWCSKCLRMFVKRQKEWIEEVRPSEQKVNENE